KGAAILNHHVAAVASHGPAKARAAADGDGAACRGIIAIEIKLALHKVDSAAVVAAAHEVQMPDAGLGDPAAAGKRAAEPDAGMGVQAAIAREHYGAPNGHIGHGFQRAAIDLESRTPGAEGVVADDGKGPATDGGTPVAVAAEKLQPP